MHTTAPPPPPPPCPTDSGEPQPLPPPPSTSPTSSLDDLPALPLGFGHLRLQPPRATPAMARVSGAVVASDADTFPRAHPTPGHRLRSYAAAVAATTRPRPLRLRLLFTDDLGNRAVATSGLSLLLSGFSYGRDGCHQATAARREPSSATPATHELQACHAFKTSTPSASTPQLHPAPARVGCHRRSAASP